MAQLTSGNKIMFMEGFDGAWHDGGFQEELWMLYRMWHSASFDPESPSAQAPNNNPTFWQMAGNGHTPEAWTGTWYSGMEANLILKAPALSNTSMLWRTGSGLEADKTSAFPDVAQGGATIYLGFAFRFPSFDPLSNTGSDGVIKAWMGDCLVNGYDSAGGGTLKYFDDPGEPCRQFNGRSAAQHMFQEQRLCLEIQSGSVDNVTIYKSDVSTGAGSVGTAWLYSGDWEIVADEWYWVVWEVTPNTNGHSAVYFGNSTVPAVQTTIPENTRDAEDFSGAQRRMSNLAIALRGPQQGEGQFDGGYESPESVNNQVNIDDIVMFINKKPAETYCVILSASHIQTSTNYTNVNASDLLNSISESKDSANDGRLPITSSWASTSDNTNEIQVRYAEFPYVANPVQIYGVGNLALCSSDNSSFDQCTQNLGLEGVGFDPHPRTIPVLLPDKGGQDMAGIDDQFVYMRQSIWPTGSSGTDFTVAELKQLTGSVSLGS